MTLFKILTIVGLLSVGMVYGQEAPPKGVVTNSFDIGENSRKEVVLTQELRSFEGSKPIDKKQFNELLKRYSELMITGSVLDDDRIGGEIGRQTDFLSWACQLWCRHPELNDRTTTYHLKSMRDFIYSLIKVHEIPNYISRSHGNMSVAEAPMVQGFLGWKDDFAENNKNGRENEIQSNIKNSRGMLDACTRVIDKAIADESASR